MREPADAEPPGIDTATRAEAITGIRAAIPEAADTEDAPDDSPTQEIDLEPEIIAETPDALLLSDTQVSHSSSVPPPPPIEALLRPRPVPREPPDQPRSVRELREALRGSAERSQPRPISVWPAPRRPPPPPLPHLRAAAAAADAAAKPSPSDGDALHAAEREVERLHKQLRERDAKLSELEAVLDQRSEALLAAEAREGGLLTRVSQLESRVEELEAQLRERTAPRASAAGTTGDNLRRIRGIGAGFERTLRALGVESYAAIAAWSPEDIASISKQLKTKPDRIQRERWVEQAQALLNEN